MALILHLLTFKQMPTAVKDFLYVLSCFPMPQTSLDPDRNKWLILKVPKEQGWRVWSNVKSKGFCHSWKYLDFIPFYSSLQITCDVVGYFLFFWFCINFWIIYIYMERMVWVKSKVRLPKMLYDKVHMYNIFFPQLWSNRHIAAHLW